MRPRARYSLAFFVVYGIALQFLLSLPAGNLQAYHFITHIQGKSPGMRMALPFLAAPFNMGGSTLRFLYEILVGPPAPARSGVASGAISHFHVYLPMLIIQAGFIAYLFARRFAPRRSFQDPVVLGLAALVLANSLANVAWPWWGK
jgi:hypothetical protein